MKDLIGWLIISLLLTFMMEIIRFQSIRKVFCFVKQKPRYFMINLLIVSATLVLVFLTSRKIFLLSCLLFFWLFLAVVNAIVTALRGYALMFSDVFLIKEGLSLSSHYFTPRVIGAIIIGIVGLILAGAYIFQFQASISPESAVFAISYLVLVVWWINRLEKRRLSHPTSEEYAKMGFAYAMMNSLYPYLNRKPAAYSEGTMARILKGMAMKNQDKVEKAQPNIIFLQLESFFDPMLLEGVSFSEDPIPTFRQLKESHRSQKMQVQTFGGGTAKTEFSVLTSMSAELLKPGEIPHLSVLKHKSVESLATQLGRVGYTSTLIHNYEGNFYNRHLAYEKLGFSRYIPIEYMSGVSTPHDLAQMDDQWVMDYILKTLEKDEPAFIYGITAGTHQPYDEGLPAHLQPIEVLGHLEEPVKETLQNYVTRLHQLDQQLKRLMDYLESSPQETLVVMFSDHLPNLSILTDETYYSNDRFEVDYFVLHLHPRFELAPLSPLNCYDVGTWLMKSLNLPLSVIQNIHESYRDDAAYREILRLAQYDQLEGKGYLTAPPLKPEEHSMSFGMGEQKLQRYFFNEEGLVIEGEGFNVDSQLFIDHKKVETIFISDKKLLAKVEPKEFSCVSLKQLSRRQEMLGEEVKLGQKD